MDHSTHTAPGGTLIADQDVRLVVPTTIVDAGRTAIDFTIVGRDGTPVTEFTEQHEKELHLIAVRRDLSGFQHVHPNRDEHGVWHTDLDLTPGAWRLLADIAPSAGAPVILGADLFVGGDFIPQPLAPASRTASVDGYTITFDGELSADEHRPLTFTVSRGGVPVTDLQPYLAAYGHLVALRAGDLAYLHVHPDGHPGDGVTAAGPDVAFVAGAPSAGEYRLFLDFGHHDVVRTAEFTVAVPDAAHHH